jgi:hypothetical protein
LAYPPNLAISRITNATAEIDQPSLKFRLGTHELDRYDLATAEPVCDLSGVIEGVRYDQVRQLDR